MGRQPCTSRGQPPDGAIDTVPAILVAIDLRLAASYLILLTGCAVYFDFDRNDRARFCSRDASS